MNKILNHHLVAFSPAVLPCIWYGTVGILFMVAYKDLSVEQVILNPVAWLILVIVPIVSYWLFKREQLYDAIRLATAYGFLLKERGEELPSWIEPPQDGDIAWWLNSPPYTRSHAYIPGLSWPYEEED
ncbi:MAG: hypothetical protein V1895_04185 [Parcubacteria group bacterium]